MNINIENPFVKNLFTKNNIIITHGAAVLLKIVIFSLIIETPPMGLEWEIKTIPVMLLLNGALLTLILSPAFLFHSRQGQGRYAIGVNIGVSFFILANRIYYMFFYSFMAPETFFISPEGLSMWQAILSTLQPREFLWFADIPLLYYLDKKIAPRLTEVEAETSDEYKQESGRKRFAKVAVASIFIFTLALNLQGDSHPQQNINLRKSGLLPYYLWETVVYVEEEEEEEVIFEDEVAEIEEWFSERQERNPDLKDREFFAEARGKNIILLQVEALQDIVINKSINGQEITPNLNELLEESIYFPNTYDQVDMATADAEVLANLSLFPIGDTSVYMRFPENRFNSLANNLLKHGYRDTAAFHGHEKEFYNRAEAYPQMGFNYYFSLEDFEKDEIHGGLLGDKTFLRQTVDKLNLLQEPYYAFVITLTSHHPFSYLQEYDEIDVGPYEDTIVGNYIKSIHYTDAAIGEFYELLKARGMLEDTLLVLYGDHVAFNYNEIDRAALQQFFDADMTDPVARFDEHKVPLIMRLPDGDVSRKIKDSAGMIDIFPTIANLVGVENKFLMGRDLLNTEESMVGLKGGSFRKEEFLYYAPTKTLHNLETGEQRMVDEDHEWVEKMQEKREISSLIYQTDFFRKAGIKYYLR